MEAPADRQTDKSTRWAFTAFEPQWEIFKRPLPECVAEIGWQEEIAPETGKHHYQGYIRTKRQCRFAQLKKQYPGVHIETARNWDALLQYCAKGTSSVPGTQVNLKSSTTAMTMKDALIRIASHASVLEPTLTITSTTNLRAERSYVLKKEYWELVTKILEDDPDAIGLYVTPVYMTAWINTRSVWIELAKQAESLSITDSVI